MFFIPWNYAITILGGCNFKMENRILKLFTYNTLFDLTNITPKFCNYCYTHFVV